MKVVFTVGSLLSVIAQGNAGLVGYGIEPYKPLCAHTCLRSLSTLMLECSSHMHMGGHMHGGPPPTTPQCRAGDTPWLTTLAWCIHTKCVGLKTSELETFWEQQSTESPSVSPKWDYSTALNEVMKPPTKQLSSTDESLNSTALVDGAGYEAQFNALSTVQRENVVESGFGYVSLSWTRS